jgi:hypothetical protein
MARPLPCMFCGFVFDHDDLGKYGCPNCEGLPLRPGTPRRAIQPGERLGARPLDQYGVRASQPVQQPALVAELPDPPGRHPQQLGGLGHEQSVVDAGVLLSHAPSIRQKNFRARNGF